MPWWGYLLQGVVFVLAMSAVAAWLTRARETAGRADDPFSMVYPRAYAWLGGICVVFFGGLAILSRVYANETSTLLVLAAFLGFAAIGFYLVFEALVVAHRITPAALCHRSPFRGASTIRWNAVDSVRYSPPMKWYVLDAGGRRVRVSAGMTGQVAFARTVLDRVSADAIDPDTMEVLEAAAAGYPPPVMA